ncbi:hypothetical protein P7D52_04350 [Enterococcus dongliensis]|uniref:DUF2178 domain-containing protein n=1 Tax=Enterococcus dongliensis TaxID=2559925 RepID=A0AAP5KP39_9ENTE|nr:hypothetical protein [Enterococcus dongliensis]MDT2596009.1 hypothetical protein [Enterococcus dongliensis]MDT2603451.1 hypothetical protein [Enterococcus dongliensis]MDT2613340.1 hypothetical protein [Enterococcus dongliensis]MDT2634346.1 hypothetical protein [Enterococcus dongliensis]MDT2636863.1 hypothetical protein [Enterococcus dongliensis]
MNKEATKSDQEYRKKLKRQNLIYLMIVIFMLACSGILFVGTTWYELAIKDRAVGFLLGFFLSLSVVFMIYIIRNRRAMNDSEKLKKQRIAKTDERNLEIASKALQITGYVMATVLVLLSLIGSFISKNLMFTASSLLYVFLTSYLICYVYFRKKL